MLTATVIGSGPNGLSVAIVLAAGGVRTTDPLEGTHKTVE